NYIPHPPSHMMVSGKGMPCPSGTAFRNNGYAPSLLGHAKPNQTRPTGDKSKGYQQKRNHNGGCGRGTGNNEFRKVLTNKTKTKTNKREVKPTRFIITHHRLGYLDPYRRFFWAFFFVDRLVGWMNVSGNEVTSRP